MTITSSRPWLPLPRWLLRALGVAALACLAAGCATQRAQDDGAHAHAGEGGVPPGIVSVTYADPARFSDARSAPRESAQARQAWLNALSLHLADQAAPRLPEGQRLTVHITDVQRAGGFEPWRGPQAGDVRIVRDIYPPRIDLEFKLLAADGRVLREGRRQLRDGAFLMRPGGSPTDPLRHEKALVDDWVRMEFARKG
ncbi:MAG: DUF3016 domain-containing protein [Comamonadaceae bacterium]|nr:MAG: DUF3016 domain-containing protein [Comamonadaceae bacterium]